METGHCCVYNATRGCRLNSTVTVADSVRDPLKVLKVLIEGLARDGKSGLWLTPLVFAPNLTRLFPFDFAYLDDDFKVTEAVPLAPGMPLPQFNSQVASALILPFDTFSSTGTCAGDRLIICDEAELDARIAEVRVSAIVVVATDLTDAPIAVHGLPVSQIPKPAPPPDRGPRVSLPGFAGLAAHGTRSTLAMTTSWQISTSTMAAVLAEPVLPEPVLPETALPEPVPSEPVLPESVSLESVPAEPVLPEVIEAQHGEAPVAQLAIPETDVEKSEVTEVPEEAQAAEVAANESQELDSAPALSSPSEQNPVEGIHPEESKAGVADIPASTEPIVEQAVEQTQIVVDSPVTQSETLTPEYTGPARNVPSVSLSVTPVEPTKSSNAPEEKKKESLGVLVKRFLNCEDPLPERRSIIRLLSKELVACIANGEKTKLFEVRDVSPTGLYLRTEERWQPNQLVSLLLRRKDAKESDYERRVRVKVKTVRCDDGGIGVSWLWPEGVEFQPWNRLNTKRSDETDADYFLRELRLTGALGLLRQICPSVLEEIKLAFHQRLSNKRVAGAVEISLRAQELLAGPELVAYPIAHPEMVRRILENGSWAVDDWIRQWWAGLLASSCSADGLDTSNAVFIDLLAKLTPGHLRLLKFVCGRDTTSSTSDDPAPQPHPYCTASELIEAVGSQSLSRIQQTMGQLSSMGLLVENRNPSYVSMSDKGKNKIEPTPLALKMYARCNGGQ